MFWHFNSIEKVKRTLSRQIFNIRIESKLPTLKAFSDTSKVSISVKRCSFETCSKRIIHPFFRSFFVCRWQMKRKTGGKKYLKNILACQDGAAKITALSWSSNNMKLAVCTADRLVAIKTILYNNILKVIVSNYCPFDIEA